VTALPACPNIRSPTTDLILQQQQQTSTKTKKRSPKKYQNLQKEKNKTPRHQQDKTTGTKKTSKHKKKKNTTPHHTTAVAAMSGLYRKISARASMIIRCWYLTLPIQRGCLGFHCELHDERAWFGKYAMTETLRQ
jgi:hypothetical protein